MPLIANILEDSDRMSTTFWYANKQQNKNGFSELSVHISHLGVYLSQEAFQYVDITYLISLQGVLCELKAIKFGIGNQEILIVITIQP